MDYRINGLIDKVSKTIDGNEKYWTSALEVKAETLAAQFPHDHTVVGMYNFLRARASKNHLISRAELQDAHRRLYSRSHIFRDAFINELGPVVEKELNKVQHDEFENKPFTTGVNPDLMASVAGIFGNGAHRLSEGTVKKAEAIVMRSLNSFSYKPYSLTAIASNEDGVVCSVDYETPKGMVSVVVPVEVESIGPLTPTTFVSTAGFVDLTEENLNHYLQASVGKKFKLDPSVILQAIKTAKGRAIDPITAELDSLIALSKMGTDSSDLNGIVGLKLDDKIEELPQAFAEETATFAQRLSTVGGEAEFLLGKSVVEAATKSLIGRFSSLGYRHPKIKISGYNTSAIIYSANVDNAVAFTVQANVANGTVKIADVVVSNGEIFDFTSSGMNEMMSSKVDVDSLVSASSIGSLNNAQKIEVVRMAVADGNLAAAEEAIYVIQQTGDEVSSRIALAHYLNGIGSEEISKTAAPIVKTSCSMKRKVSSSKYEVCGHTGLPIHKVYQDEHGACLPLYRKASTPPGSPSIMQNKIEWT